MSQIPTFPETEIVEMKTKISNLINQKHMGILKKTK